MCSWADGVKIFEGIGSRSLQNGVDVNPTITRTATPTIPIPARIHGYTLNERRLDDPSVLVCPAFFGVAFMVSRPRITICFRSFTVNEPSDRVQSGAEHIGPELYSTVKTLQGRDLSKTRLPVSRRGAEKASLCL